MDQGGRDSDLYRTIANEKDDFRMQESIIKLEFLPGEFARETMKRYKDSNQDLYKLVLKMEINNVDCASLATELIMDALNLSVKKLHIEFAYSGKPFVLPYQVFESKSLIQLSAEYCIINQPIGGNVACLPLVSLTLISANIKDDMMSDILSRCPLIEYLDLMECIGGLTKLSLGETQHNIRHCLVEHMEYTEGGFLVEFSDTRFPNLSSLVFTELRLEKTFFHNSTAKFPNLIELSLHLCWGFEEVVEISLPSLKFLIVEEMSKTRLIFNVPNLCKFRYLGWNHIPPLYINTSTNALEYTDIKISVINDLPCSWFLRLQEFLQNLRIVSKKISLCLSFTDDYDEKEEEQEGEEGGREEVKLVMVEKYISSVAPRTPVENLVFERLLSGGLPLLAFSNLLGGLLSVCRLNLITLIEGECIPPLKPTERDLPTIELLFKSVTEQAHVKYGLKNVTLEMLYNEEEWRLILWEDLVSFIRLKIDGIQIRLKLEWHEGLN